MGPSAGLAVKPFCWRAKRRQRCRELYVTPAIRATTVADSPASTNSTARRRLRSNSAAVPIGLIFILYAAVLVSLAAPSAVVASETWKNASNTVLDTRQFNYDQNNQLTTASDSA